ncbi:RabGAP/TBC [Aspergillus heteromorphus CBS 117.55]|uniref:GTPase-activating protein GYP5 n=1 Tax=Aspergillus heteromorphus CBS 117.55 TaxID=1448321 RepID=A0A317WMR5_9EURO|nr:RabGAP/TBC [Aspergillus heteromorphus CBS 117.55]PWY87669.1 RabGAP/TBC [Aspergillus heteromorphus CBS 117.55]
MSSRRDSRDYEDDSFDDAPEAPSSQNSLNVSIPQSSSTRSLTDSPPSGSNVATPQLTEAPPLPGISPDEYDTAGDTDDASAGRQSETEDTPRKQKKSPLLTAHRLSTTSLDDVNLASSNKEDGSMEDQRLSQELKSGSSPPLPSRDSMSSHSSRAQSFPSNSSSAPANKNSAPVAPPPPPTRSFTSPFSWLSRNSSSGKDVKSPPAQPRRNTAASISTISSNPDRHHDGEDADGPRKPRRSSLKDQFKQLRMREEGHAENDEGSVASGRASFSQPAGSPPPSIPEEGENDAAAAPRATSPPNGAVNPNLAPGTVAGFSTSATDASAPVDWELWQQLVNNGTPALKGGSSETLNAAIKRGIPQTIRGVIWQVLADSRNPELEEVYRDLVARGTDKERQRTPNGTINGAAEKDSVASSSRSSVRSERSPSLAHSMNGSPSPSYELDPEKLSKEQAAHEAARKKKEKEEVTKLEKTIRRDLGARTSYSRYFVSQGNQEGLFGLCKAYALYDEAVGYAQGMNFIAMPLLFNMDEAEAFTLLVKLMNQYGLRELFIHDMPGLHRCLYLFERLLEDFEPALYCHLRRRGVPPQLYATQWFLTLFAYRFPLQLVLRVYDLIFEEGLENTLLKFALAIMHRNADALLEMKDMAPLTTFLKERLFDVYIDKQPSASSILESGFFGSSGSADKEIYRADIMVQDACAIPIEAETIGIYTAEWEEQVRAEREREAELEHLKHTVAVQSARVRLLEEQAEASDKEHVQLASELVHLKVENEELTDMNDAMKMQVKELKKVVDQQPAEVEEKLRTEMDRIMKRNLEVQNENRSMVEQMAEMEKELVEAKMKWAEIHDDHENLKQKWSDLRRALD